MKALAMTTLAAATLLTATVANARDPDEGFDGAHCQFISEVRASGAPGRTRPLAIARWQNQIRANCPEFSTKWWRAKNRYVTCQTLRHREVCTAGGAPARKFFGWLAR
jgi:hypothetical protein